MERGALHHFDVDWSRDGRKPPASPPTSYGPMVDPLVTGFETDLGAWLTWLGTARSSSEDARLMRRLQIAYAVGWTTVTVAALAIAPLGVLAATLCVVLIAATLLLGYLATAPRTTRPIAWDDQVAKPSACPSSLGALERAQLVRIINLCRIVASRRGEALLRTELHKVLAGGQLAGWAPLLELQEMLVCESSRLTPFGSRCEENVLESPC